MLFIRTDATLRVGCGTVCKSGAPRRGALASRAPPRRWSEAPVRQHHLFLASQPASGERAGSKVQPASSSGKRIVWRRQNPAAPWPTRLRAPSFTQSRMPGTRPAWDGPHG